MKTWYTLALSILIGATGVIGPALAADMTGAEIIALVSGKTIYLETTAASPTASPAKPPARSTASPVPARPPTNSRPRPATFGSTNTA